MAINIEKQEKLTMAIHTEEQEKLTMHELCKRLDNEFDDVDMHIKECATKGCVAVVYFYEDVLKEQD